jgi:iron-sulfur cluster repair protein YtfE (RIC family)
MEYSRHVARTLHDEHITAMALLERVVAFLAGLGPAVPPVPNDREAERLLAALVTAITTEVASHFRFEEEHLFPRLAEHGDGDLGRLLIEEHEAIVPVGARVVELATQARRTGFTSDTWSEFHRLAGEYAERLTAHAQKEEIALVPLLDELLDADGDMALAEAYAALR